MSKKADFTRRLSRFIGSETFFRLTIVLLAAQAVWLVFTARYPMAFDEDFHFGIIKLYAHHLSPFWNGQPENADMFGAVARDPSYLYHWLMSFPYRFFDLFISSQTAIVILLRLLNVGMMVAAFFLFRRLLLKTGAPRRVVHVSLAVMALLPIVPMLAAQINYDNLMIPAMAGLLLLSVSYIERLKLTGRPDLKLIGAIIIVGLLASLIKYAFLPILLAVGLYLIAYTRLVCRSWSKVWLGLGFSYSLISKRLRWVLLAAFAVAALLFAQRYFVNIVRYHTPVPDCGKVLTVEQCKEYGPWVRDYILKFNKDKTGQSLYSLNPLAFSYEWFYGMWFRTFFAVDGPASNFETRGPLLLPAVSGLAFMLFGLVSLVAAGKRVLRRYDTAIILLFGLVVVLYVGILWLDEYGAYLRTGWPVAINGRYLLPVMPLLLVMMGLAAGLWLKGRRRLQTGLLLVLMIGLIWGGGGLTYVLRSRQAWYWPNGAVLSVNRAVQQALGPVTPGYSQPTLFLRYR